MPRSHNWIASGTLDIHLQSYKVPIDHNTDSHFGNWYTVPSIWSGSWLAAPIGTHRSLDNAVLRDVARRLAGLGLSQVDGVAHAAEEVTYLGDIGAHRQAGVDGLFDYCEVWVVALETPGRGRWSLWLLWSMSGSTWDTWKGSMVSLITVKYGW
jgi:hypothetical protein